MKSDAPSDKMEISESYTAFPSPRPSPQGRGSIVLRFSAQPKLLFFPRVGLRVSLSPRERAGVRGKETIVSTMGSLCSGSGARKKLLGVHPLVLMHSDFIPRRVEGKT